LKKKVLIIGYSQSGQLYEILDKFQDSFKNCDIKRINIQEKKPFPFPWPGRDFFDAMPESVLEKEIELERVSFKSQQYDFIIIGYQPWFLSPSIPVTSLFKNDDFLRLLNNTPVLTIIGSRNMWLKAHEVIREKIFEAGGYFVANIPFYDRHNNFISALTTVYWMLTGRKDRMFRIFPLPGISNEDINKASEFGQIMNDLLQSDKCNDMNDRLLETGFIKVGTNLLFIEQRAKVLFKIWANLIVKKGTTPVKRRIWVQLFKYYLIIALFIVAPIVLLFYNIFVAPITKKSTNQKKEYYLSVLPGKYDDK